MQIRSLHLTNVNGFEDLELRFPDGRSVLVGDNGAGKSTVLDSVAMFLAPLAAILRGTEPAGAELLAAVAEGQER